MIRAALIAALWAAPAYAKPMTAAEFGARVTGKTVHYNVRGMASGSEEYLPNQRSRWMGPNGQCTEGTWFELNGQICFDYPDSGGVQCWVVEDINGRLHAYQFGRDPNNGFISYKEENAPLPCPGPDLGV